MGSKAKNLTTCIGGRVAIIILSFVLSVQVWVEKYLSIQAWIGGRKNISRALNRAYLWRFFLSLSIPISSIIDSISNQAYSLAFFSFSPVFPMIFSVSEENVSSQIIQIIPKNPTPPKFPKIRYLLLTHTYPPPYLHNGGFYSGALFYLNR